MAYVKKVDTALRARSCLDEISARRQDPDGLAVHRLPGGGL